ncbi:hypothetical protein CRENBAI_011887 [Crenichthys baileyi]|uniref:Uncharacterized protein n=1 Tax=Crenichthys baileyi TaxID=28760 RepID=A0AAV9SDC6_9TELE
MPGTRLGARATDGSIGESPPQQANDQAPQQPRTPNPETPQHAGRNILPHGTPYLPPKRSHIPITAAHCPAKTPPPEPPQHPPPTDNATKPGTEIQ